MTLLLVTSSLASLLIPTRYYGKIRTRWCRTPHGYCTHHYDSTLRTDCIHHLHTHFKRHRVQQYNSCTFNTSTSRTPITNPIQLGTDSCTLIIDNGCSTSITTCIKDFISPPWQVRANIEGYSGSTSATHIGTVCWKVDVDLGQTHDMYLPNTYYSPHGKHRLLCPQHWAQTAKDHYPHPNGTWCAIYSS